MTAPTTWLSALSGCTMTPGVHGDPYASGNDFAAVFQVNLGHQREVFFAEDAAKPGPAAPIAHFGDFLKQMNGFVMAGGHSNPELKRVHAFLALRTRPRTIPGRTSWEDFRPNASRLPGHPIPPARIHPL